LPSHLFPPTYPRILHPITSSHPPPVISLPQHTSTSHTPQPPISPPPTTHFAPTHLAH
jgi:hypothetical protein